MTTTATLHTSLGDIVIELFPNHAPKTVANFVELASGKREWVDPRSGEKSTANLYDGTVFHRVIEGFMIQGGDPLGSGMGGPGYNFADEFHGELNFDKPYLLAMANAGPNTNGSQFFITVAPTAWIGRSPEPVFVLPMASTTFCDAASFTSPKMVCLRLSQVVGATVIKNCEPLVPGPEFAIARMYGRSKTSSPWNSSSKRYPGPPVPVPSGSPP